MLGPCLNHLQGSPWHRVSAQDISHVARRSEPLMPCTLPGQATKIPQQGGRLEGNYRALSKTERCSPVPKEFESASCCCGPGHALFPCTSRHASFLWPHPTGCSLHLLQAAQIFALRFLGLHTALPFSASFHEYHNSFLPFLPTPSWRSFLWDLQLARY